jgi:hypothetical protein
MPRKTENKMSPNQPNQYQQPQLGGYNQSEYTTTICSKLLELYSIGKNVTPSELQNLVVRKSQVYGLANIYGFDYKNHRYYASDDYSLMDNPVCIQEVFAEVDPALTGKLLKNPTPQSDGAMYAGGLDGTGYYLWEV